MRTDLLLAGGLAALVVGGVLYVAKHTANIPVPGRYPAVATSELYLRAAPNHLADIRAIIEAGSNVRVDSTPVPDWFYVYYRDANGRLLEGYSRAENLGGLSAVLPLQVTA